MWWIYWLCVSLGFGITTGVVAEKKGLDGATWTFWGLLFGPFALAVAAVSDGRNASNRAATSSHSNADEIAKLADLKANGILNDEEFEAEKAKVLRRA